MPGQAVKGTRTAPAAADSASLNPSTTRLRKESAFFLARPDTEPSENRTIRRAFEIASKMWGDT